MSLLLFLLLAAYPPEQRAKAAEISPEVVARWQKVFPARKGQIDNPKKVSSRKGPVELTLEVANTKVRRENGEYSLWLKVSLRNVGKAPIQVDSEVFRDAVYLENDPFLSWEIRDERGREVVRSPLQEAITVPPECGVLRPDPRSASFRPPFELNPGQIASTPERWQYDAREIACLGRSRESPIPPYGEIRGLGFFTRGARARLHFHNRTPPDVLRRFKRRARPEEVDFYTDWIELEIVP